MPASYPGALVYTRGTAREGEKRKIRREAPGKIRIQNGGSVFCRGSVLFILLLTEMTLFTAKYGFVHYHYSLAMECSINYAITTAMILLFLFNITHCIYRININICG